MISGYKLKQIPFEDPIYRNNSLDVFEDPVPNHYYAMTVDNARGGSGDASAFIVFDVTALPYKVVAKYQRNDISAMLYPDVIKQVAKKYNEAMVLIETNDIGESVANTLAFDLEYENIIYTKIPPKKAVEATHAMDAGAKIGVWTTHRIKIVGCSNLKQIIETDKLIIRDFDIVFELTNFVSTKVSYAAQQGTHDDLVMCLVLFGWLVTQDYFKDLTDINTRHRLYESQRSAIEDNILPFFNNEDADFFSEHDGENMFFGLSDLSNPLSDNDIW